MLWEYTILTIFSLAAQVGSKTVDGHKKYIYDTRNVLVISFKPGLTNTKTLAL